MKIALFFLLLVASPVFGQLVDRTALEIGATADLRKRPSLFTRLAYSAPISDVRIEGGAVILWGRDGGFGFDVLVARPFGQTEPLIGTRMLVWERSMSVGFPLGVRYQQPVGTAELTFGITVAPTLHLSAEEKHTIIVDSFIGVRF